MTADAGPATALRTLVAWSSGKDSAWMLHALRQRPDEFHVVGLLTTTHEATSRVAMHGVRPGLLRAQADAAGLPLTVVPLPWPCPNEEYERRMATAMQAARADGVEAIAFGDLFLADLRAWREQKMAGTGIRPVFPLWQGGQANDGGAGGGTAALARQMLAAGLAATLATVDLSRLPASFAGRAFNDQLLADLPPGVDPCGENGEFHTFAHGGPMFSRPIAVQPGAVTERDGFACADLLPAPSSESAR